MPSSRHPLNDHRTVKRMTQRLLLLFLLVPLSAQSVLARDGLPQGYLASVGGRLITEEQFRDRYKTYLLYGKDEPIVRQQVLETLINEDLLLTESAKLGLTEAVTFKEEAHAIRQQVLLDQFRERVLGAKVVVTEDDLMQAFRRYHAKVAARHIFASTEREAWEYKRLLDNGMRFEDLARQVFKDSYLSDAAGFLGYFSFGDMDPAFEEAAFTLPIGKVSDPIRTAQGYSILRVEDRVEHPLLNEADYLKARKTLRMWVRRIKVDKVAIDYSDELKTRLAIDVNRQTLQDVMDTFVKWPLDKKKQDVRIQPARKLDPASVLRETLVTFRGGRWTVEEFFQKAQWTSERQRKRVRSNEQMVQFIEGLVVRDALLSEARAAGLETDPVVLKEIDKRERGLTEKKYCEDLFRDIQIPEAELRTRYEKFRDEYIFPEQARVLEILVSSPALADELAARARSGEDFQSLARHYTIRPGGTQRSGDLGFIPRERFGPFAETIFSSTPGSIVGPLAYGEAIAIYKVIGFKERRQKTFDEAREEILAQLTMFSQRQKLQKTIEKLKQNVVIVRDYDRLAGMNFSFK